MATIVPAGERAPNAASRGGLMRERDDLALIGLLAATIILCWLVVLGWPPGSLVSGHDAVLQAFTPLRDLAVSGAGAMRYRPELMGGAKMADAFGNLTLPWLRAALALGLSPLAAYNASIFLCQLTIAFLGLGAVRGLIRAWGGREAPLAWHDCAIAGVVLAFAPVLAWRIGYGHINLLLGALGFYIAFCAVILAATRTLSACAALVAMLGLWNALESTGQQIMLYGAVFGAPVLVALFLHLCAQVRGNRIRAALLLAALALPPLIAALPAIGLMYAHATSSDAARGLHTASVIYGFATSTWRDWAGSLPWSRELVDTGRPLELQHELNYAFGPLLLGLALVPASAARSVGIALAACASLALLFSMDVAPVSAFLPELIPPLHAFRVPARALLPFGVVVPVIAVAALAFRYGRAAPGAGEDATLALMIALLAAGLLAIGLLPGGLRELLVWGAMLAALVLARGRREVKWLGVTVLLLPLAGASLAAFKERTLPFASEHALIDAADRHGRALKVAAPQLESALTRVRLDFDVAGMWLNSGYAMRVSTLDGYWAPSRRMLELHAALEGRAHDPARVALSVKPEDRPYPVMRQMYNLCCEASLVSGSVRVRTLGRTAGEAWVPRRVARAADPAALAEALRSAGDSLAERLRETLLLLESDPHAMRAAPLLRQNEAHCGAARIERIDAPHWDGRITLEVSGGAGCALVVATNYAETLRARDQDGASLATFPAYGPLLGVVIAQSTRRVTIGVP